MAAVIVSLMWMSPVAHACSCFGTTGIGTALTEAENVVLGVVVGRKPTEPDGDAISILADVVEVRVLEVLKGRSADKIRISEGFFCYRSFGIEDFAPGDKYVLPIDRAESNGVYMLPGCSHTALKLVDGQLYTHELTTGYVHRLESYMSLRFLKFLLPTGMLGTRSHILTSGGLALLLPMVLAARFRTRRAVTLSSVGARAPIGALRSLNLRTGLAAFTMLLCAAASVYAALPPVDWVPWVLSALFALAAAGIALRWTWTEGLSYGLVIIVVGICCAYLYDYLKWFHLQDSGLDSTFAIIHSVALSIIALMVWCAITVRRRFDPVDAPAPKPAVQ